MKTIFHSSELTPDQFEAAIAELFVVALTDPMTYRIVLELDEDPTSNYWLIDFSNSGTPFMDNTKCFMCQTGTLWDDSGREGEYMDLKSIAYALIKTRQIMCQGFTRIYVETF